jgi:hypothetical protein
VAPGVPHHITQRGNRGRQTFFCDADGCPVCPCGEQLVWEDYDIASEQLIYRGNPNVCRTCPLAGTCPKQFEHDAGRSETFWGMVPGYSRLARRILHQFRPRVEPGFILTKNKYCITDFFINSRSLAQAFCIASDILETLEILAKEWPARARETRQALIRDISPNCGNDFAPTVFQNTPTLYQQERLDS